MYLMVHFLLLLNMGKCIVYIHINDSYETQRKIIKSFWYLSVFMFYDFIILQHKRQAKHFWYCIFYYNNIILTSYKKKKEGKKSLHWVTLPEYCIDLFFSVVKA